MIAAEQPRGDDPKEIIEHLEKITFNNILEESDKFKLQECAICMETFKKDENLLRIPKCQHFFHPHCIDQWLCSSTQ